MTDLDEIEKSVDFWCYSYIADGYKITSTAKELMRLHFDVQLHPERYSTEEYQKAFVATQLRVDNQVKKDNGESSPLSGLESTDEIVNKAVGEIKEKIAKNEIRSDYYKGALYDDKIANPQQLYDIERELDSLNNEIFEVVGGKDKSREITDWCNANLNPDDVESINKPFRDLITSVGKISINPGDKLRDKLDQDLIQRCKDALLYAQARYNSIHK